MDTSNLNLILFILLIIILLYFLQQQRKEHFIDSNFSLCKEGDCECLKMKTAPDGTCVKYEISKPPLIPDYENKKIYKKHVVRNNLYPKKRNNIILIFVGIKMRNKKTKYENLPRMLQMIEKVEYGRYSEDPECHHIYEVFENANTILSKLDGDKPFLKWLILSANQFGEDESIMKAYKLDRDKYPAIYMYNETTNKLKTFKLDKKKPRCQLLQELIIFIADGDCGLISYLNHLEDPYLGIKFYHDSKNNTWEPNPRRGVHLYDGGTDLCKLIDYKDLNSNFKCKP
jgi:hypothetical protein